MVATTRLSPRDAPQTEIVRRIKGIGVWDMASEIVVYITSIVNRISIIASMHMRASIKCLCCIERPSIITKNIIVSVILMSSITRA